MPPVFKIAAVMLSVLMCAPAMAQRDWTSRWTDAEIEALGFALSEAWTHGLDPSDYADPEALAAMAQGQARDRAARAAWFDYAEDLAFGRVDPRDLDEDWTTPVRDQDLMTHYAEARETGTIYESFEALAPQHPDYIALRSELVRRTALPSAAVQIAPGPSMGLGDLGPRVDALRARLYELGFLATPGRAGEAFNARLETALIRFQARANLAADGRLGRDTLAELNAADSHRLNQLRANLERWRWLPADLGHRHIRVNIADYRLEAWENGRVARAHEAQIGTTYASTPVFSEAMSIVEINPWWLTPTGLGQQWVRRFQTAPAYAYSEGFRLVDLDTGARVNAADADWDYGRYRVIQAPGPNNAMGKVKFLFPNVHNVYIHDTPHRELFANAQRSDSSGCVRVQDPEGLAVWVLEAEGWSPQAVREVFAGEQTRRVRLRNTIPVHMLYFTAVTDQVGRVRFVHDVYDRDRAVIDALDGVLPDRAAAQDGDAPAP
jgi:murein L,D-transpeptidase YcbB/YkuD